MKPRPPLSLRRSSAPRGFTLIEVLVALAIFAFSGLMLASAYVNVLSSHRVAMQREALVPALRLVREALRAEPERENVESWNELSLPDKLTARWKGTIEATPVADLFDVTLEIEFAPDGGEGPTRKVTETCRLLRPTWSEPAERETLRAAARSILVERTHP